MRRLLLRESVGGRFTLSPTVAKQYCKWGRVNRGNSADIV